VNDVTRSARIARYVNYRSVGGLLFLVVALQCAALLVHPFGDVRASAKDKPLMNTASIEHPVLEVMQRSCQNCHSERTSWPLYSRIAPVSWLIEKDVHNGRSHWNMSKWDQYSIGEREDILSQMAPMVRNRKMPLPQYLFLHPEAKLSDADVELLYRWSRAERKRLKSESEQTSSHTSY
jgi:cytochrome c